MPKSIPDTILDLMLDQAEATHFTVCSAPPADYAGISAVALTSAAAVGSVTPANGDVSGRKNTYAAVTGVPIIADGEADHIAFHNNADTLYMVTTCLAQALVSGGTVDVSAFDHEIGDPS